MMVYDGIQIQIQWIPSFFHKSEIRQIRWLVLCQIRVQVSQQSNSAFSLSRK